MLSALFQAGNGLISTHTEKFVKKLPIKLAQMPFEQQVGVIPLAQDFISADGYRIGKVQAAGIRVVEHWDADAGIGIVVKELLRQARRFLAEHKVTAVRVRNFRVRFLSFGGKVVEITRIPAKKIGKTLI